MADRVALLFLLLGRLLSLQLPATSALSSAGGDPGRGRGTAPARAANWDPGRRSSLIWLCNPQLAGANLAAMRAHHRDFTMVSWWGTASILNDTGRVHFHYNDTYAPGEAVMKAELAEIGMFPVLEAAPPLMAAAAEDAAAAAVEHGWAGYNIDYEPGGLWSKEEFAIFLGHLEPLAQALHAAGLEISVDICCAFSLPHAVTATGPDPSWIVCHLDL
eukprot:SAG22_NODE_639_length_8255_cov_13.659882_10_plen_217_part_00